MSLILSRQGGEPTRIVTGRLNPITSFMMQHDETRRLYRPKPRSMRQGGCIRHLLPQLAQDSAAFYIDMQPDAIVAAIWALISRPLMRRLDLPRIDSIRGQPGRLAPIYSRSLALDKEVKRSRIGRAITRRLSKTTHDATGRHYGLGPDMAWWLYRLRPDLTWRQAEPEPDMTGRQTPMTQDVS